MSKQYGFPYMGSKSKIIGSIASMLPKAENLYDLFGGGFSLCHYLMIERPKKYKYLHYNDIKPGNKILIENAIAGKYSYENFKPPWVSRDDFHKLKSKDPYVAVCWSFGNDQQTYLFGPDIEGYKRSLHNAVVGEFDSQAVKALGIDKWPSKIDSIKKRRIYVRQKVKALKLRQRLERLERLEQLQQLQQLQRLEQLQQLQQLQQLEGLQQLDLTCKSYDQVSFEKDSVIYCDIPYKDTTGYGISFDHTKFLNWASSIDIPVFISEYKISDPRFKLVYKIDKRSQISADKTLNVKSEKLYWNGK